jgi:hypothetical protein
MAKKEGMSVRKVTILSMLAIAYVGWGLAASGYAYHAENRGPTVISSAGARGGAGAALATLGVAFLEMLSKSLVQIPSVFSVIGFTFRDRPWLPIAIVVVEGLVIGGGYLMWRFEQQLETERRRNRRSQL